MVFHWGLSDSKPPHVSRILLNILIELNSVIVLVILIQLLISNSSWPLTKPLGTIPSAPITIGITITFMFDSFLSSLARSKYSSFFDSLSVVRQGGKVHYATGALFFVDLLSFYSLSVFHSSVSWWSFTRVQVSTSLLKSPALQNSSQNSG